MLVQEHMAHTHWVDDWVKRWVQEDMGKLEQKGASGATLLPLDSCVSDGQLFSLGSSG